MTARDKLDFDPHEFRSQNGDYEQDMPPEHSEQAFIENRAGDRFDTLASGLLDAVVSHRLPGHEAANLQDLIASLLRALHRADEAINPPDWPAISMHEWNGRLKSATAAIRDALNKAEQSQ